MKFKSQVYTEVSGSIGGITYAHNAGGMYARARALPTNPNTPEQSAVRAYLATLMSQWNDSLTAVQRTAWDVYAANVPVLDKFGDSMQISGINHFVRSNVTRQQAGLAVVEDAPTVFNTGVFSEVYCSGVDQATAVATITFNENDTWNVDNGALMVWASRPQNAGINFFRGPFRFLDIVEGDTAIPLTSPQTMTLPDTLAVGQQIFFRARAIFPDGRMTFNQFFRQSVS